MKEHPIAIVGMSCRVPGAETIDQLWRNLRSGTESVRTVSQGELQAAGVPLDLRQHQAYVRRGSFLADLDQFDATAFSMPARQAVATDPQLRLLLECAWEALEDAGDPPREGDHKIGVYAGAAFGKYMLEHAGPNLNRRNPSDYLLHLLGNDKDHLATTIAYKLGCTGPAMTLQTACSTALVALHQARKDLIDFECDVAIVATAAIRHFQPEGYLAEVEGILSLSGRCRPFAAEADGTLFGSGAGAVVLKRLDTALEAGNPVYAVLGGTAVNNDGSRKLAYSAPSVRGQIEVVKWAQEVAEVSPAEVGYVEAHGTGTPLGDAVEVDALAQVWGKTVSEQQCVLGSVKGNLGHLEVAAGMAGLIKTALCIHHQTLVPSLGCTTTNPELRLESTPFRVGTSTQAWPSSRPVAGITALGMGGTNAHAVLKPCSARAEQAQRSVFPVLLPVSGATTTGRDQTVERIADACTHAELDATGAEAPALDLEKVSATLTLGRVHQPQRRAWIVEPGQRPGLNAGEVTAPSSPGSVAVVFGSTAPAGGSLARPLTERFDAVARAVDDCAAVLRPALQLDLHRVLRAPPGSVEERAAVLFTDQVALWRLWKAFGLRPEAVTGCGLGAAAASYACGAVSLAEAASILTASVRGDSLGNPVSRIEPRPIEIPLVHGAVEQNGEFPLCRHTTWQRMLEDQLPAGDLERILERGCRLFLELGNVPGSLSSRIRAAEPDAQFIATPSLDELHREITTAVAAVYLHGHDVDFRPLFADSIERVRLPAYAFHRRRHWVGTADAVKERAAATRHTLRVDPTTMSYVQDHRVDGTAVIPGAFYVDWTITTARRTLGGTWNIRDLVFERLLAGTEAVDLELALTPGDAGVEFQVDSSAGCHARGVLVRDREELKAWT